MVVKKVVTPLHKVLFLNRLNKCLPQTSRVLPWRLSPPPTWSSQHNVWIHPHSCSRFGVCNHCSSRSSGAADGQAVPIPKPDCVLSLFTPSMLVALQLKT